MSIVFPDKTDKEIIFSPNKVTLDKEINFSPSKITLDKEAIFNPKKPLNNDPKFENTEIEFVPSEKEVIFNPKKPLNNEHAFENPEYEIEFPPLEKEAIFSPEKTSTSANKENAQYDFYNMLQQIAGKKWIIILIIGYIILKNSGALINLSQYTSTDLLIIMIIIGLIVFWHVKTV
ncbi:hypothetical protein AN640_08665 [Candidatus Epulonipiscium fishelsonii]|uniref:Uncharacterized protein n=1 Tax=Candidatus Epulonipiscium fishelsonii TaxID=77094 RepID=A0ACC8XCW1_9FIRM|nr:hypothetical protein AN640_08665 [Epulopiscium sp. SCG-D08WGA-EpuloA1]OON96317.1 MAG: hypothetical protein ATN32_06505 [Epulopiscium sp. AS2M-Bin002]